MVRRWARDTRAVLAMVPAGLAALLLLAAVGVSGVLCVVGVGVPALDAVLAAARRRAVRRRRRLPEPVPVPSAPWPESLPARLRLAVTDAATWRDLAWLGCCGLLLLPGAVLSVLLGCAALGGIVAPLLLALSFGDATLSLNGRQLTGPASALIVAGQGVVLAGLVFWLQRGLVSADDALARVLLRPTARALLSGRVTYLTESRADTVDAQARELRRIERDLHDGAQAHLTAVALNLGLAEQFLDTGAPARALVADARTSAGIALEGLRDIVRGIHPPVLAERGLIGGVQELVMAAGIPVQLRIELPDRLAEPVESALYFTVAELLTNATRHSGAERVELTVWQGDGEVRLTVHDDGHGGATVRAGGGLDGLRRRLAAFDGRLVLDSPPGGPTRVEVAVPCGS